MTIDSDTIERAMRLRRMTRDMLANMSPQERDRMLQQHLAQARGPVRNAILLRQMTAMVLRAREAAQAREAADD